LSERLATRLKNDEVLGGVAFQEVELLRSQRTQIFNDLPSDVDSFGFTPVVRALSEVVLSETTQTPLTVCIDGQWGSGKSSIMQMIEKQARLVAFPCVWLNAWSLQDTDNLISSLAEEIKREAEQWEGKSKQLARYWKRFMVASSRALLRFSGPTSRFLSEFEDTNESLSEDARKLASIVTARRSFEELVKVFLDSLKTNPELTSPTPDSPPVEPRLIVFVDDIDRALPDQIVNMLKTLRLVLDNKYCVFVLGMDFELVAQSIVNYYSGSVRKLIMPEEITLQKDARGLSSVSSSSSAPHDLFGRSFLEKLIQLHVRVPGLDRNKVTEFVQQLDLDLTIIEIIRWAPDSEILNPRRLKRYINWLSITLQLVKDARLPADVSNLTALRVLALRRDFPEVYDKATTLPQQGLPLNAGDPTLIKMITARRFISEQDYKTEIADLQKYLGTFLECIPSFEKSLIDSPLLQSTVPDRSFTGAASKSVETSPSRTLQSYEDVSTTGASITSGPKSSA